MRVKITIMFLLLLGISSMAQSLDGTWKGNMSSPQGDMELTFDFKTDGNAVSGKVISPMGELPISNGKIDGNKFSFDVDVNGQVISHDCVIEENVVEMSMPMMPEPMKLTKVVEESGKSKINGKWKGTASNPQGDMELTFTFDVNGNALTGTDASPMGEYEILNGVINENDFSFDVDVEGMSIKHKCKYLDDDSIEVIANVMDQDMPPMKLTRVAE